MIVTAIVPADEQFSTGPLKYPRWPAATAPIASQTSRINDPILIPHLPRLLQ
jgi:hypothetical protein